MAVIVVLSVNIFKSIGFRGFFIGPSARSGYLCTAPGWKTERRRSEVCKKVQCKDIVISHSEP